MDFKIFHGINTAVKSITADSTKIVSETHFFQMPSIGFPSE